MTGTYQNIEIDGVDVGRTPAKRESAFCNVGKWRNYILPLLPADVRDMTFIELGCNAGLFLKLAKGLGFRTVIGVDKSRSTLKLAARYQGEDDYQLINAAVGGAFDAESLPAADVVLMANFHYYLHLADLTRLLDTLRRKAQRCIIVTAADVQDYYWRCRADPDAIRHYFREWREVGSVGPLPVAGDPYPRTMTSLAFDSPLVERRPLAGIWRRFSRREGRQNVIDLVRRVATGDTVAQELWPELPYFRATREKNARWSDEHILNYMAGRIANLYDVKRNGMREPVFIRSTGQIIDGTHRVCLLRELGHRSILTRVL